METKEMEHLIMGWLPKNGLININGIEYPIDNVLITGEGIDTQIVIFAKTDEK